MIARNIEEIDIEFSSFLCEHDIDKAAALYSHRRKNIQRTVQKIPKCGSFGPAVSCTEVKSDHSDMPFSDGIGECDRKSFFWGIRTVCSSPNVCFRGIRSDNPPHVWVSHLSRSESAANRLLPCHSDSEFLCDPSDAMRSANEQFSPRTDIGKHSFEILSRNLFGIGQHEQTIPLIILFALQKRDIHMKTAV